MKNLKSSICTLALILGGLFSVAAYAAASMNAYIGNISDKYNVIAYYQTCIAPYGPYPIYQCTGQKSVKVQPNGRSPAIYLPAPPANSYSMFVVNTVMMTDQNNNLVVKTPYPTATCSLQGPGEFGPAPSNTLGFSLFGESIGCTPYYSSKH